MRNLKKFFAVGTVAAMTMAMSVTAFAEKTVTIHFENNGKWNPVGAWVYEGIAFDTNVTPAADSITTPKADGSTKVLWPGAKMVDEGNGWVKTTVTFSDEVDKNGMVMIFNNYVGDSTLNDTTEQDDLDAIANSGIATTATATKEQTNNVLLNKKKIAAAGGVQSDLYVSADESWSFAAPANYAAPADNGNTPAPAPADNGSTPANTNDGNAAANTNDGNAAANTNDGNTAANTNAAANTNTAAKSAGVKSNTNAPKTGDTVAVSAFALAAVAAIAVVAAKRKVNA